MIATGTIENKPEFPALRDPRYPIHKTAHLLEPYLRAIVENIHPVKIILFGSQAYGEPTRHSDYDLLIVREGITSSKASNIQIRNLFWEIDPPLSFTLLSKTPEEIDSRLAAHSPLYEEIVGKGLEVYAARAD
jgi:predicted nucleotidyltransferase